VEIFLPLLILGLVCGTYSSLVAGAKGYEAPIWFFSGLLFGPLALLALIGMPDLKLRKYLRLLAEHQGALSTESPSAPPDGREDADAQRRRILGVK
jgi:hypothetical protein